MNGISQGCAPKFFRGTPNAKRHFFKFLKHAKRKTPKIGQKWTPNAKRQTPNF